MDLFIALGIFQDGTVGEIKKLTIRKIIKGGGCIRGRVIINDLLKLFALVPRIQIIIMKKRYIDTCCSSCGKEARAWWKDKYPLCKECDNDSMINKGKRMAKEYELSKEDK